MSRGFRQSRESRFIRGYEDPVPLELAIRKKVSFYCIKAKMFVHICRMVDCDYREMCIKEEGT